MKPLAIGSAFSGIGGIDLGFERAGWRVAWQIENDASCAKVLTHRFPGVKQYGDIRTVEPQDLERINCLAGGFPCQGLSVAGKRLGLRDDPRSALFFEFIRLAEAIRPPWLLIENVPGLLSSHRGADFAVVLHALDQLGYGVVWRVLDAQFFGVPQRRRRVFLVGHLGARCPQEVLFEPQGGGGDTAAGEGPGQDIAGTLEGGSGEGGIYPILEVGARTGDALRDGIGVAPPGSPMYALESSKQHGVFVPEKAYALRAGSKGISQREGQDTYVIHNNTSRGAVSGNGRQWSDGPLVRNDDRSFALNAAGPHLVGTLRSNPRNNSNPMTEARTLVHSLTPWPEMGEAMRVYGDEGAAPNLKRHPSLVAPSLRGYGHGAQGQHNDDAAKMGLVRRLTPRECERLQGFPDDWTLVDGMADSPRYRMLGNAVARPVAEWIGRRMARAFLPAVIA